jgi:2-oxoglutarate ferredoxin oxidoreductase subunit delta
MSEKRSLKFELNRDYCKACGICYGLCPKKVLEPDGEGKPAVVRGDDCILCRLCEYRCPDFAIRAEGV